MADNRTMKELLQAPTEGYGEAIVISEINADHFEIKKNLLQLVQANPYHGFKRENPHTHINNFKRITSTLKFRDVSNDVIKLMMFPYSLEGAAGVWYDKKPHNSILTWEDLVNKFVNQFFPASKTTHLKNEISLFTQRFKETFGEAWERFKEMLRACPHHEFIELTQIDTFYNGLNENDQDSLNAAAGGNLLSKTFREALHIIENKSKIRYSRNKPNVSRMNTTSRENASKTDDRINKLADQILTLVDIVSKKVVTPATVKAVEESCVTCGGNHAYYNCDATNSNQPSICAATGTYNQVAPQNRASNYMASLGFAPVQNSQNSNTIPNPKGESKEITTRSGVVYEGPLIPTKPTPKKVVKRETEEKMDKEQTNFQGSTAHMQPPKPDVLKTLPKPNIPYPSRLNDQKLQEKTTNQMEKFFQIFQDLHFNISFADALLLMPKFASTIKSLLANKDKLFELAKIPLNENCSSMLLKKIPEKLGDPDKFLIPCDFSGMDTTRYSSTYDDMSVNRIDVIDVAREEYAKEILGFSKNSSGGNPTSTSKPIISKSSPCLIPFEGSDFILEEIEAYLKDESISPKIDHADCVDKLPVIIAKDLKDDEKEALLKVLKAHKQAIAWKITDIKGIDSHFCTHKILMEEDYKPAVQSQRHVNPKIHEVGVFVLTIENNELIPTRLVTDGFSGYFQIPINPPDQEKTTFTCPYGTFAYRRMPFGLCNSPRTFQRCMMAIFHDMIEKSMEVFMDDFSVFGVSFSSRLSHLDTMLQRCEDTNLVLNWEKCTLWSKRELSLAIKSKKINLRSIELK
uniref:Reverse transcriptase domain-containing protein n=1 Tax=Tanacetum cinerariifolium TaxID=118510 RepID=A0A6L2NIY9_TANCI|nr:reverse transcriptase domain-containing protein [Tanacetum cinerariifolium]